MNDKLIPKALALYYFSNREILIVGNFTDLESMDSGKAVEYTVWDDVGRLDKNEFDVWDYLPSRDEIRKFYVDLIW